MGWSPIADWLARPTLAPPRRMTQAAARPPLAAPALSRGLGRTAGGPGSRPGQREWRGRFFPPEGVPSPSERQATAGGPA